MNREISSIDNQSRQPRVFISRTTAGLKDIANDIAELLRQRGVEPVIQTEFLPDWRSVPQMLQQKMLECDCVIALIGPVHGGEPTREPACLRDTRTHGRRFSFTQWEYLVARDLRRPLFTFLVSGPDIVNAFEPESLSHQQRQQQFIDDFTKDGALLYCEYSDRLRLLEHIDEMDLPLSVVAGKPSNLPYVSLGTLFKGRDGFLAQLRAQLTSTEMPQSNRHRTIHGMGGSGKTRTAIEYAWKYAPNYNALLFAAADTTEMLHRNIAALCGPLILNLPEQDEKDMNLQLEAVVRWLELHPGWLLLIDNVDSEDTALEARTMLGRLSQGDVIITSRLANWAGHVKSLDLDVLNTAASVEFLDERTVERRIRKASDGNDALCLASTLGGLALALEQAGAHICSQRISYSEYIVMWESKRSAALAWHDENTMQYPRSLAITYETSVAQLSPEARTLFHTLAWFAPDPIIRRLLDSRSCPEEERRHFREIEHLHLAHFHKDGKSFSIHRLNQEITRQQQDAPQPDSLLKALGWMFQEYRGDLTDPRDWRSLEPLTPHAISIASFSIDHGIDTPSNLLLNDAARFLNNRGRFRDAMLLTRKVMSHHEKTHPQVHLTNDDARQAVIAKLFNSFGQMNIATSYNNMAQLLQDTNQLAEAERLMRQALSIDEKHQGPEGLAVGRDLNNLASLLQAAGRTEEAESLYRRALHIHQKLHGADHPVVAKDMNNLATLLCGARRFVEAEPLMAHVVSVFSKWLHEGHPDLAVALNNWGQLLQGLDQLARSEELYRRAVGIYEQSNNTEHPNAAIAMGNLSSILFTTNRLVEAEELVNRAVKILEGVLEPSHPNLQIMKANHATILSEIAAGVVNPYLEQLVWKRQRKLAIQSENYELAGRCRDELLKLESCEPLRRDVVSKAILDRVVELECVALPVKRAIGGRLMAAENADSAEALASLRQNFSGGVCAVEYYFADFADFSFRDLCEQLSEINDKQKLLTELGVGAEAQRRNFSVSPDAWLAYATTGEPEGGRLLFCIANRWVQLSPTRDEAFQVADIFERLGYLSEAAALRAGVALANFRADHG